MNLLIDIQLISWVGERLVVPQLDKIHLQLYGEKSFVLQSVSYNLQSYKIAQNSGVPYPRVWPQSSFLSNLRA